MTPAQPAPTEERRVAPRFQPTFGTICLFRRRGETGEPGIGLVWNISESGISMLLAEPPERGTRLDAELKTESGSTSVLVGLLVVHIREMPHGDFFLGAQFDRHLTLEELQGFLVPPPRSGTPPVRPGS